ncbi:MAG: transposase [Afipia broomeae]|jgi:transposase
MGRSRGGLTTKIHALVDGRGLPIQLHLSEGQASDCKQADALLGAVPQGSTFLADKAYDSDAIRRQVEAQGGFANIPAKRNLDLYRLRAGHPSHYATLASNASGLIPPRYEWRRRVL